jgi:hypothetical protein
MELTLESGKVVKYEKPNFRNRTKIWDRAARDYKDGVNLSLENCMDIALYCKVCTEQQLNNDEYTVPELYEIGGILLGEVFTVELDKKKLK